MRQRHPSGWRFLLRFFSRHILITFAALHDESKLWIAYPKKASKIASDLNRDCSWECIREDGFEESEQVVIDHVWNALQFKKAESIV